jgi:Pyruvate/2-oxoacid:ferredoxin oxidoreductase gamma subunit
VLIAMNELSLKKFASDVAPDGIILYNGSSLPDGFEPSVHVICVPAAEIADIIGSARAANIVMLGALLEETACLTRNTAIAVLEAKVKKVELLEIDRRALAAGRNFIEQQINSGPVSQPDGFA